MRGYVWNRIISISHITLVLIITKNNYTSVMNNEGSAQLSNQSGNGIEKELFFVASIEPKLVGKNICGYVLNKVYLKNATNDEEKSKIANWALRSFNDYPYGYPNAQGSFIHIDDYGEYCLYFIRTVNCPQRNTDASTLMRILSIYKESAISFSDLFYIKVGGVGNFGRVIHPDKIGNNLCENECGLFQINDAEIIEIEEYYNHLLNLSNINEIDKLLDVYMIARRTYVDGVKIVLYVTVLEMILNANTEITYRLSRTIAVLLGKTKDESNQIFTEMKAIYKARSIYVHSGTTKEKAYEYVSKVKNISRETISKLINICYTTEKTIKEIEEETKTLGFGEGNKLLIHK